MRLQELKESMKEALVRLKIQASSIAQGGRIIAASEADYDTYELESTICA